MKYIILLSSLLCLLCACDKEEEAIPAYVHVKAFNFTPGFDESKTFEINRALIYVDTVLLGVFTLPCTFPVIGEGTQEIIVDPMVDDNGITSAPNVYTYYTRFLSTVQLQAQVVDSIQPTTTYNNEFASFQMVENFEGNHIFKEEVDGNVNTKMDKIANDPTVLEGSGSGRIVVNTDNPIATVSTTNTYILPKNGTAVYIELDYTSDIPFAVGLLGTTATGSQTSSYKLVLNPSTARNKTYINVTEDVVQSDLEDYRVVINTILPDGKTQGSIILDNIKLISYQP